MNQRFPHLFSGIVALALCLSSVPSASAITITPTGSSFGSLPDATFGGTGIPNNAVQIFQFGDLTLGLTATQRKSNPALTNDGAGTFYATPGGDTLDAAPTLAQWNFDYYIKGLELGQSVTLFWDNDPAAGNNVSNSFTFYSDIQDSENLGFGSFNGGVFDPNASGVYGFALVANQTQPQTEFVNLDREGPPLPPLSIELGRAAILVNVGDTSSVPDGGNMMLMFAGAISALAMLRRRFVA